MTIESVVIIIVGFAATVFLLSFSWWLWTRAPVPPPRGQAIYTGPPLGPPPDAEQWMGWAQPNAPVAPPSPERELFEQSTLIPVGSLAQSGEGEGELDKARTMFFFKKGPEAAPDKTQILSDALELELAGAQDDAAVQPHEKVETAPVRQANATRRPPPPPPPRRSHPPPPPRK